MWLLPNHTPALSQNAISVLSLGCLTELSHGKWLCSVIIHQGGFLPKATNLRSKSSVHPVGGGKSRAGDIDCNTTYLHKGQELLGWGTADAFKVTQGIQILDVCLRKHFKTAESHEAHRERKVSIFLFASQGTLTLREPMTCSQTQCPVWDRAQPQ